MMVWQKKLKIKSVLLVLYPVRPDGRTLRPREVRSYYSRRRALRHHHQQDLHRRTARRHLTGEPWDGELPCQETDRQYLLPHFWVFSWAGCFGPAHLSLLVGSTPVRCRVLLSECFFSCISLITSGPAFLYHRHLLQLTIVDRHLLHGQFACRYWLLLSGTHSHTRRSGAGALQIQDKQIIKTTKTHVIHLPTTWKLHKGYLPM
jgi:hypothetical protein